MKTTVYIYIYVFFFPLNPNFLLIKREGGVVGWKKKTPEGGGGGVVAIGARAVPESEREEKREKEREVEVLWGRECVMVIEIYLPRL